MIGARCAGVTTYKAVKVSGAGLSDLVAVFGVGGLGHLAVQYAAIAGATVVAVDLFEEKLNLAKELGAAHTVDASKVNPIEEIKKLGGADFAICVAISPKAFEQAFGSTQTRTGERGVCRSREWEGQGSLRVRSSLSITGTRGTQ